MSITDVFTYIQTLCFLDLLSQLSIDSRESMDSSELLAVMFVFFM